MDLFCITGLFLGIRHGLDFDHVTAIADLVGATVAAEADVHPSPTALRALKLQSCWLAAVYAGGHAVVVVMLGVGALFFRAVLPSWIDPLMQSIVGLTLIVLGGLMLASVTSSFGGQSNSPIKSRGTLLLSAISQVQHWVDSRVLNKGESIHRHEPAQLCDWRCAATIGALHGIGAETGTQVLLIASLSKTGSPTTSVIMLSSFVLGMLLSNISLAFMFTEGYSRLLVTSRWLSILGALVAIASMVVGFMLLFGYSSF